jgi:D-galactarolactone cycloisomerase
LKKQQHRQIARVEAIPVSIERDLKKATGTAGSPSRLLAGGGKYKWSSSVAAIYSERLETTLVKITTDDGLTGWGEAQAPVAPRVSAAIIDDILASVLEGAALEPSRQGVEQLWDLMFRSMRVRGQNSGFMMDAISGVDLALWDLAAQANGVSVSQLIAGSQARTRIPAYLSGLSGSSAGEKRTFARGYFDRGFRHNKVFFDASEAELLATLDGLREELGPKANLAVDALWRLTWPASREFIAELAQRNLLWLEAPFLPDEEEPHRELARAFPQLRLALGESYRTRREMNWFLGFIAFLQPDLGRSGITESLRLAEVGIPMVPHVSVALGPQIAAAIHLTAALRESQAPLCEFNPQVFEASNRFLKEPLRMEGCDYCVPQSPGLGVSPEVPTVVLM